jgi:3D (Asp-Asp-Asp) domain-containing protein
MKMLPVSIMVVSILSFPGGLYATENNPTAAELTPTVRLEVVVPPGTDIPEGWIAYLQQWLGARTLQRVHPPVGTQLTVVASAYAPSLYQTDSTPCVTAAGTKVRPGVIATNFLPMGTLVEIDDKVFIVEDRMNPRYGGYYIDVFLPHTTEALDFGRQKLTVTIIGYGEPGQPLPGEKVAEQEASPVLEEEDFVERLNTQFQVVQQVIGRFIGARTLDPNRYDVDCFGSEDSPTE